MANYYNEHTILYLNGEYVKATEAKMDLYSQSLHYGYSVFEGIRSYKTAAGETKIFKPLEHFERLKASAQALNLPYTYDTEDLIAITYEVLKLNNLQDAYIRPVIFAPANMSFTPNIESFIFILYSYNNYFFVSLMFILNRRFISLADSCNVGLFHNKKRDHVPALVKSFQSSFTLWRLI